MHIKVSDESVVSARVFFLFRFTSFDFVVCSRYPIRCVHSNSNRILEGNVPMDPTGGIKSDFDLQAT
jgi:hypothetical protein